MVFSSTRCLQVASMGIQHLLSTASLQMPKLLMASPVPRHRDTGVGFLASRAEWAVVVCT